MKTTVSNTVAHPFSTVKSSFHDSVIHHKVLPNHPYINRFPERNKIIIRKGMSLNHYGVSSSQRVLTPGLLLKKFDYIRDYLQYTLGLPPAQREVILRLLPLWAYYGSVYPKEAQITELPGCSKATFWRTIKVLKSIGLIGVVNRYLLRPHAQISNLYLLHNLIVVIARYLAEHGQDFNQKWIRPFLIMPGSQFWPQLFTRELKLPLLFDEPRAGSQ